MVEVANNSLAMERFRFSFKPEKFCMIWAVRPLIFVYGLLVSWILLSSMLW